MKDDKINVVNAWLKKAENDLRTAEYIMTMDDPPYDTVCFHAQQCAEKYIKGFLTFHEIDFPKTHSIEDLVLLCEDIAPSLESELGDVEVLSSYAMRQDILLKFTMKFPKKRHARQLNLRKELNLLF